MKNTLSIFLFILIIWLIIYLILEYSIVLNKKKAIDKIFSELDNLFLKRLNVLYKMMDTIKMYNKIEFEELNSKLYDYVNDYESYELNKKIKINEEMERNIKKVLLVSKAYPELEENTKYIKSEKQITRLNKVILKLEKKYNKEVKSFENRKKIFPSNIICLICKFYHYDLFDLKD